MCVVKTFVSFRRMRDCIVIILVTMSVLRPGYCGECGTLEFHKKSYIIGGCASLIYKPESSNAGREWHREISTAILLNISRTSKYSESIQGDQFTLTIYKIEQADAGVYAVSCARGKWTDRAYLNISTSTDGFQCGLLEFEQPSVYKGEPASLIYKPDCAVASVDWYKIQPQSYVRLYPEEAPDVSTKYTELKTDESFILRIGETELTDAGNYTIYCGKWSRHAQLNIIEQAEPSHPEFRDVENILNCSKCLPARLNVRMTVECFTVGGSEPVELNMFKSGTLLSNVDQTKDSQSKTNTITYDFTPTNDNFDTVFKCTVKNPALQVEKFVTTKLYIKVDPESIEIKAQPTKENETSHIQCTTINGRPPTTSLFYIKNNLQTNSVNITKTIKSGYTYNVTSTLWTKLTRQDNHATVNCCSDSSGRVCSNIENLNVTFSPKSAVLTEISKENKENGDTVFVLKCDVDESNPKSFVVWKGLKKTPRKLLEEMYTNHTETHGWAYTTSWMFNLTKVNRHRDIRCQVQNSEFPDLSLEQSYTPNITYFPVITISESRNKTVYVGDDLTLTCDVDSNPPSVISWSNKDAKIEESNGTNKLDIHLFNVTIEHSQTYTCTARNGIGGTKSKDITLFVKVPSEKTYIQPSSKTSRFSLLAPAIGGAVAIIIVIVTIVVFLTLWKKKNDAQPKRKGKHQIEDEPRHEGVSPARNEFVPNDMPASNDKEVDSAPEYACVIPKANRKHTANELKSEDTPEYSGAIPKSKRKSETEHLTSGDSTDYACVIPKAQRKQGMDQRKSEDESPKSQGDTLVYAELDLNFDLETTKRRPLTEQYEPTEYVTIDFSKIGTVKIEKKEIEKEPKKENDEMAEGGMKKENIDI